MQNSSPFANQSKDLKNGESGFKAISGEAGEGIKVLLVKYAFG
jgi:hypothetical protein